MVAKFGNSARAIWFFYEQCQSIHETVAAAPLPPYMLPKAVLEVMRRIPAGTSPMLNRIVDCDTLESCMRRQSDGKMPGSDGLPSEYYKYGPAAFLELLLRALDAYLNGENRREIPSVCAHEWFGSIVPVSYIPKKLSAY